MKILKRLSASIFLILWIVACGGGGSTSDTPVVAGASTNQLNFRVSIGADKKTINPNERILLKPTINDNNGSIRSYVWTENGKVLGKTESLSYVSSTSGIHTIVLTVIDGSGKKASATIKISINKILSVDVNLSNSATGNIKAGDSATFTSNVQNGSGSSYSWSIDDVVQAGATANTFSSTFTNPGSYTVTVTVKDANGKTATNSTVVTVLAPSNSNSSTTPSSGSTTPQPVPVDPLTQGLKAWYKFDGNSNDSSGNGNHGIDTNMTYVSSAIDKGAKFDGNSSFIMIPQSDSLKTFKDKFTLSFWTKHYYTEVGDGKVVVHITNGLDVPLNGERGFYNYSTKSGISFRIGKHGDENNTVSVGLDYNATEPLLAQDEQLITFVVDSLKLSVYKNAELKNSVDRNTTYSVARPSSNWFIGNMGNVYYLNGIIDDMRLYNRALSGAEIQKLYELKK